MNGHTVSRRRFIAGVSVSAASVMIVPRPVLGRGAVSYTHLTLPPIWSV